MFSNIKFKYKIMALPFLAVIALLLSLFVTQFFGNRNSTLLTQLEAEFASALELGYNLEKTLTEIQRSMQDAVAAADQDEFEATNALVNEFLQLLEEGYKNSFFSAENLKLLKSEFQQYYELARNVSQSLIEEQSLEGEMINDLQSMSERYNALTQHVKAESNLAKEQASRFFATTLANDRKSTAAINVIIICCTILLGVVSIFLSRSITTP